MDEVVGTAISFCLYMLLPPVLDGIERKVRAKIQSRYGPPTLLQTWYDILKLAAKELVVPPHATQVPPLLLSLLMALAAAAGFLASRTALTLVVPSASAVQLMVVVAAVTVAAHSLSAALYTLFSNPFSIIGTFRLLSVDVVNEMAFLSFVALAAFSTLLPPHSPPVVLGISAGLLGVVTYALTHRLPYDLHEAEPELASGALVEFSGPLLSIYLYASLIKRYIVTSLPAMVALRLTAGALKHPLVAVAALHALATALYVVYAIVSSMLGRSRVNMAVRTLTLIYLVLLILWVTVYSLAPR